jgi:glyoxylase-like metal-dependent hydrolase (beta-lactamase superfamily II)
MPFPEPERAPRARDLLADDIVRIPTLFANLYAAGTAERWVLVDTGLPGFSGSITRAVAQRFGTGAAPEAIILTHGHWDHAGSALELAKFWEVPIYAHRFEVPYLTGKSDYAPKDPTVGGLISVTGRLFPSTGYDFGTRVSVLPANGAVPGLPEWRWIHTPGHTHGHVALFRERDRVLLAGDAIATVNQDHLYTMVTRRPEFYRPPAPFTVDWNAATESVQALAKLAPRVVGAGHGWPIKGPETAERFSAFARRFRRPAHGRYVKWPVQADETGIVAVPPAVPDRALERAAVWAGVGALTGWLIMHEKRRRREKARRESE